MAFDVRIVSTPGRPVFVPGVPAYYKAYEYDQNHVINDVTGAGRHWYMFDESALNFPNPNPYPNANITPFGDAEAPSARAALPGKVLRIGLTGLAVMGLCVVGAAVLTAKR